MSRWFAIVAIIILVASPALATSAEADLILAIRPKTLVEVESIAPVVIPSNFTGTVYAYESLRFTVKSNGRWIARFKLVAEGRVDGLFYMRIRELNGEWLPLSPSGSEVLLTDDIGVFSFTMDLRYVGKDGPAGETKVWPIVEVIRK